MGHKTHSAHVTIPKGTGLQQLCLLVPRWTVEYGEQDAWSGYETLHPVYPILYDVSSQKFAKLSSFSFECEKMLQPTSGRLLDNAVEHLYASGKLLPFIGEVYPKYERCNHTIRTEPNDVIAAREGVVLSGSPDKFCPFPTYFLGLDLYSDAFPPIWMEFHQEWSTSEESKTVLTVDSGRSLYVSLTNYFYGERTFMSSEEILIPDTWSFSGSMSVSFPVRTQVVDEIYNSDVTHSHEFLIVPISPTFVCPPGTLARERWVESHFTTKLLDRVESIQRAYSEYAQFDAVLSAANAFRELNLNGIAFLRDLQELKNLLEPFMRVVESPTSPAAWAALLLSIKYGILPTQDDVYALFRALKSLCSRANRKRLRQIFEAPYTKYGTKFDHKVYNGISIEARYNSRIRGNVKFPVSYSDIDVLLQEMGLRISAKNVWDLIPFSFVVNWFTQLSSLMAQIDYQFDIMMLMVRDHVFSSKYTAKPSSHGLKEGNIEYRGPLDYQSYTRAVANELPSPPWGVDVESLPWNHLGEILLLLIQRIGK